MTTLFENAQWAVTDWGMQSVEPGAPYEYDIEASRLLESIGSGDGEFYSWPLQLAEKTWVDIALFNEAFRKALELHEGKYSQVVRPELLKASIAASVRMAGTR